MFPKNSKHFLGSINTLFDENVFFGKKLNKYFREFIECFGD